MSAHFCCIQPTPYKPRFRTQLIFSAGLWNQCSGAVLTARIWSRFKKFCSKIIVILVLTNVVWCSGPLSVYKIRTGGMFSFDQCCSIRTLVISLAFLHACFSRKWLVLAAKRHTRQKTIHNL